MAKGQLWETRPLEFWGLAKDLRAKWQKSIGDQDKVVGQGSTGDLSCDWTASFPALTLIEDNPVGAMMQNKNESYARRARLASEIRGWGREICGYQGNCWGGQFLGYIEDGSSWPKRKLVTPCPDVCDQHTKRGQQARDYENMPQWMADRFCYFGPFDAERNKYYLEHEAYCNLKVINDIERIFGQKCDDENLIEQIGKTDQIRGLALEIELLMARTIPSPLSVKDLFSVFTIGSLTKVDPDATISFWKTVRDEVKWRADNRIAAVANERFRWIETHPPPWHFMKYYRYMEQYGAVCLGSEYSHASTYDVLEFKPDGSISPIKNPMYPEGTYATTREDAVRIAGGYDARLPGGFKMDEFINPSRLVEFAKIFQADGALLPIWRHGVGCTFIRKQQAMYLKEAGLSVMHYEGSAPGDRIDMDEKRFLDQLDNWMQSLGLQKFD